jgi:hypothetical protein
VCCLPIAECLAVPWFEALGIFGAPVVSVVSYPTQSYDSYSTLKQCLSEKTSLYLVLEYDAWEGDTHIVT